MKKLTKEQGIVLTGYTGIMCCKKMSDFHADVESRTGHSIWTHEFADIKLWDKIKELYKEDFMKMIGE